MDQPARSQPGRAPPGGEYAVFHERPFPRRLDRAFRVGAIVVAAFVIAAGLAVTFIGFYGGVALEKAWLPIALACALAALAYGFTRAVGMIVVGIYGGLQRKQYVVDWDDGSGR